MGGSQPRFVVAGLSGIIEDVRATLRAAVSGDGERGRLARIAIGTTGVSAVGTLVSFAVSVLLARVLGRGGYGTYSLAMSVALLLSVAVRLGFPQLLIRDIARLRADGASASIRSTVVAADRTSGAIGLTVAVVGWVLIEVVGIVGSDPVRRVTATAAVLLVVIIVITENHSGGLRGLSRVIRGQVPGAVLRPALLALGVAVAIKIGFRLDAGSVMLIHVGAGIVALAVATLWLAMYLPGRKGSSTHRRPLEMARASLPFAGLSLIGVANSQADILMLGTFGASADVGVYRVALAISGFASFFLGAANVVTQPEVARLYSEGRQKELENLVKGQTVIASVATLPLIALFVLAGRPFLRLVYGEAYASAYVPLLILLIGHAVNVAIGPVGMVLNMTGHEKETIRAQVAGLAVIIVASWLFVPRFGVVGAALAAGLSMITWNMYMTVAVRRRLGVYMAVWNLANK